MKKTLTKFRVLKNSFRTLRENIKLVTSFEQILLAKNNFSCLPNRYISESSEKRENQLKYLLLKLDGITNKPKESAIG